MSPRMVRPLLDDTAGQHHNLLRMRTLSRTLPPDSQ
jgi:hypothetical protein